MKKILLIVGFALLSMGLQAQVGINADETTLAPDAVLHIKNNPGEYKGVLFPKMDTDGRNKIINPTEGLMVYNTKLHCLEIYDGTSWTCSKTGSGSPTPKATATLGSIEPLKWVALEYNSTYYNSPESTIPNSGSISVKIPYSNATNGAYDAYEQTFTLLDKNNIDQHFKLSYPAGTITQATGTITATLTNISSFTYKPQPQPLNGQYNDLATVQVSFNGAGATPLKIQSIGGILDKKFGDGAHDFVYEPVEVDYGNGVKKTWLNMNLGAEAAKVSSPNFNPTLAKTGNAAHQDANLYGSYYQWQRPTDGHEFRNASDTETLAKDWSANDPADIVGKFITGLYHINKSWVSNGSNDTSDDNFQLWQAGGANNPCPTGYHVPTYTEWKDIEAVMKKKGNMFYQDLLINLAAAGWRWIVDWGINSEEGVMAYWSSERDTSRDKWAWSMPLNLGPNRYIEGLSVRCIKD